MYSPETDSCLAHVGVPFFLRYAGRRRIPGQIETGVALRAPLKSLKRALTALDWLRVRGA